MSLLEAVDLYRAYGGVQAVAGATFQVRAGTITGLIGPNGAGKSTVVNLISGQVRPDRGEVRFDGRPIQGRPPHVTARHGIIRTFQTPNLFPGLTVLENLLVGAPPWPGESLRRALLGRWSWRRTEAQLVDRARDLLADVDLVAHQHAYAGELSGGQKRLVELARALMARPRLLLLDEPMAGVSPALATRLADHLARLRAQGLTMLLIEHDLALVERLCDPVVVMAQGRVLAEGHLTALRGNAEVVDAYLAG
ncbi:MAG: ABC transporter ATP-binding protein [Actinobacteria bacterium]|nr:MAG: ABC transporter ATP-binding protein [Actinomycetota bacterium]